jgi:hypothetical protein
VNLPPPIAFGLLLTSALGRYLDSRSRPRLDSSSVIHPPLRSTHPPHCNPILTYTNPTWSSMSIRTMSSRNSTQMSARASARTSVSQFILQVRAHAFGPHSDLHPRPRYSCIYKSKPLSSNSTLRARTFGPRLDLCPCPCYDPNPCIPTLLGCLLGRPLGHLCLTLSYKFEPMPLGPAQTSILVRVTSAAWIRTARNTGSFLCHEWWLILTSVVNLPFILRLIMVLVTGFIISTFVSSLFDLQFVSMQYNTTVQPCQDLHLQHWYQSFGGFYDAGSVNSTIFTLGGLNGSQSPVQYTSISVRWTTWQYFLVDTLNGLSSLNSNTGGALSLTIKSPTTVIQSFSGCETTSLEISSIGIVNATQKWWITAWVIFLIASKSSECLTFLNQLY